jgi:hypothetical protein
VVVVRCADRVKSRSPFTVVRRGFSANNARGSCLPLGVRFLAWGSLVSRVSLPHLVALAEGMPARDRLVIETVARLTLVSGGQLADLLFGEIPRPVTRHRRARRVLARLVGERLLDQLERRRGGVRGGSSSWVYGLGPAGRRLVAYWAGEGLPRSRGTHEPGAAWSAHTLAVSDLYVQLRQAERAGRLELIAFDAEPACWRSYTRLGGAAGVLKPDAYVEVGSGDWIDSFFIEVDLASERRGQLARQHYAYSEYFRAGVEQARTGVFPGVLWLVPDAKRAGLLNDIERRLPEQVRRLFTVATFERAPEVLGGGTEATAAGGAL